MAFLTLNGWTVPVLEGGSRKPLDIGERSRLFSGDLAIDRRASKETWRFTTTALGEMVAAALRGTIRGLGNLWRFDASLYSVKGLGFTTTTGAAFAPSISVAGLPVQYGQKYGAQTTGAITPQTSRLNLLSANESGFESSATLLDWTVIDGAATIQRVTTDAVTGTHSMKVSVSDDSADGAKITKGVTGNKEYIFSGYVRRSDGGGSANMVASLEGDVTGPTTAAVTITSSSWVRFAVKVSLGVGDAAVIFQFENNSSAPIDFLLDCLMLEEAPVAGKTIPSPWVLGGTSGSACVADIDSRAWTLAKDVTVAFWMLNFAATTTVSADRTILAASGASGDTFKIIRLSGSTSLRFQTSHGGTTHNLDGSVSWTESLYTHVAVAIRTSPETGEVNKYMWVNGVLVASGSTAGIPSPETLGNIDFGQDAGATPFVGLVLDELLIVPWAAPTDQVLAWYNQGDFPDDLPTLRASGDFDPQPRSVAGVIEDGSVRPVRDSGTWRNNAERIGFTLEER